eukprot:Gregarina_sp_Poly_1__3563@NODE_2041_length_2792_cov_18_341284_g1317_i0_p1_GENE_NODE_2041_length_2792_cov_18_341284_g1317_i0NODE_2041_length_2792_cov_18_341284_g1317_i0_p1_ORF_typecomplete_len178_score20_83_NODE_2041_length_2792_cov_18_341284_g1317_i0228761
MRGILANTHRGSASLKTVATAAVSAICKLEQPPVSHIETSADIDISDDNEMKSIQSVNQNSDSNSEVESLHSEKGVEETEHLIWECVRKPKMTLHSINSKKFLELEVEGGIRWLDLKSHEGLLFDIGMGSMYALLGMLALGILTKAGKYLWRLLHRIGPFFLFLLLLNALGHLNILI